MHATAAMDTRLKPLEALRAVRALMANPEDTAQVFSIFRALRGRSAINAFRRFEKSPIGAAILRDRRVLLDTLNDRAALSALPEGSVGRTYFEFMEEENLTADGLVQASQEWDNDPVPADMQFYRERMRDSHDLTHTVTGYGRDPLGEMCLLAFMYAHTRNLGMAFIIGMNWLRLPKFAKAAVREAWKNGKKVRWMQDMDWEAVLPRPLDEVRRECGISVPVLYRPAP